MATRQVESVNIVLIGSFNPSIFQPLWFSCQGLLKPREADAAKVEIVHPQVSAFEIEDWLRVVVTSDRFQAISTSDAHTEVLRDTVLGTFRLLQHTPVKMMGINREVLIGMDDERTWDELGYRLAPKEPWEHILVPKFGMRSISMQGRRPDNRKGYVSVTVQPSIKCDFGVVVQVNDHFDLEGNGCAAAIEVLDSQWSESMDQSERIVTGLLAGSI